MRAEFRLEGAYRALEQGQIRYSGRTELLAVALVHQRRQRVRQALRHDSCNKGEMVAIHQDYVPEISVVELQ